MNNVIELAHTCMYYALAQPDYLPLCSAHFFSLVSTDDQGAARSCAVA